MTAHAPIPLFRQEALAARKNRLQGEISLAVPMSWHVIGYLLFGALFVALIFLASASYSRVETVSGSIVLDKGVSPIVPSRAGVIVELPVRDGERVEAGQTLVRIRSEEDLGGGGTAPDRVLQSLDAQDRQLGSQASLVLGAAAAERARLLEAVSGGQQELRSLEQQIAEQQQLVALAENDFRQLRLVADKGFVSRRDLDAREATLLGRRQQLHQLQQARAAKASSVADARRAITTTTASAEAQATAVEAKRSELVQQRAQVDAAKGYVLTSPVPGTVTAVTARLGQATAQGQSLMVIVPDGGHATAELYVPTNAGGFLAAGQDVRLAIDAFPYQQFGTTTARIRTVSSTAVAKQIGDTALPVYLVTADLSRSSVEAFGRAQALQPGMALTARIVTRRQTLLEWLFEPLFAVGRR